MTIDFDAAAGSTKLKSVKLMKRSNQNSAIRSRLLARKKGGGTMKLLKRFKKWAYPECDHLNVALRFLLKKPTENKLAIEEIYFAISKTNGYFYDDVKEALKENFKYAFD